MSWIFEVEDVSPLKASYPASISYDICTLLRMLNSFCYWALKMQLIIGYYQRELWLRKFFVWSHGFMFIYNREIMMKLMNISDVSFKCTAPAKENIMWKHLEANKFGWHLSGNSSLVVLLFFFKRTKIRKGKNQFYFSFSIIPIDISISWK